MELRLLLKVFPKEMKISIENFKDVLYAGQIQDFPMKNESNLEVIECEFVDNILHIQVSL